MLEEAGAEVVCLEPVPGLPDLVFTANAALVHHNTAIYHPAAFDDYGQPPVARAAPGSRLHPA